MRGIGNTGYADLTSYLAGQGVNNIYQPDGHPRRSSNVPINSHRGQHAQYLMPLPNYGIGATLIQQLPRNFPIAHLHQSGRCPLDQTISPSSPSLPLLLQESPGHSALPTQLHLHLLPVAGSPLQGAYNIP
jgi:hypothetical protein